MSKLSMALDEYLKVRRALGYKLNYICRAANCGSSSSSPIVLAQTSLPPSSRWNGPCSLPKPSRFGGRGDWVWSANLLGTVARPTLARSFRHLTCFLTNTAVRLHIFIVMNRLLSCSRLRSGYLPVWAYDLTRTRPSLACTSLQACDATKRCSLTAATST